ncbi:MAG: hypothetical protein KAY32_17545 [Candidatus Eisenbacteria sp.]|nr:hypothetical protein [Candidatus Eisenbacteria bacterium]
MNVDCDRRGRDETPRGRLRRALRSLGRPTSPSLVVCAALTCTLMLPAFSAVPARAADPPTTAPAARQPIPQRDTLCVLSDRRTPCTFLPGSSFGNARQHLAGWAVGDFDGDSWDELVTAAQEQGLPGTTALVWHDYPNGSAQTVRQVNLSDFRELVNTYRGDLDGDGATEIAVAFKRGSQAWSALYGRRGEMIYRTPIQTGPDLNSTGDWDGCVRPLLATDLTRDGRAELIVNRNAAFDRTPRGLVAYDVARNAELWSFACGSPIEQICPLSDPQTGERLLLASTVAVMNGADEGGFTDRYAYLFLLGSDGRVIHQLSWGGAGAKLRFALADLDADALPEAIVGINSNFQRPDATYGLALLDPFTFAIEREMDPGVFLDRPLVCDLDGCGKLEIISSRGNAIYVFDRSLALVREIHCEGPISWLTTWDLTGDGSDELLVLLRAADRAVLIDARGQLLAATDPHGESLRALAVLRWGPRQHLLYAFSDRRAYGCHLKADVSAAAAGTDGDATGAGGVSDAAGRSPTRLGLAGVLLLGVLLGGGAGYALARRLRRRGGEGPDWSRQVDHGAAEPSWAEQQTGVANTWARTEQDAALRAALSVLVTFGHGEAGATLARAATILQAADAERVADSDWREQAEEACLRLQEDVRPLLTTLLAHERVLSEHGAPPGELIEHYDDIGQQSEALRRVLASPRDLDPAVAVRVGQELRRFDHTLRALRQRLRASFRCELSLVVAAVLAARRRSREREGPAELTLTTEMATTARIDPVRMRHEVIEDLVTNAVRAMQGGDEQRLAIRIMREGEWVRLQITDSGCGIPEEHRDVIFHQGFSTKPEGGGLGLFRARLTVKEFGGRIYLEESTPGKGTVVTVELRAADTISSQNLNNRRQEKPSPQENRP